MPGAGLFLRSTLFSGILQNGADNTTHTKGGPPPDAAGLCLQKHSRSMRMLSGVGEYNTQQWGIILPTFGGYQLPAFAQASAVPYKEHSMSKTSISDYVILENAAACLKRVFLAAECRTQTDLAELLDIGQSSISDAKRRGSVPYEWMVKLFLKKRINPAWILTGEGPRVLRIVPDEGPPITLPPIMLPLEKYSTDELVQEIVRRGVRGIAECVA